MNSKALTALVRKNANHNFQQVEQFIFNRLENLNSEMFTLLQSIPEILASGIPDELLDSICGHTLTASSPVRLLRALELPVVREIFYTRSRLPLCLLSDEQEYALTNWLGYEDLSLPAERSRKPRVPRSVFFGHLKHFIAAVPLPELPKLLERRPGFPISFLTREQVQSLSHAQISNMLKRLNKMLKKLNNLETRLNQDGTFSWTIEGVPPAYLRDLNEEDLDRELRRIGMMTRLHLMSKGLLPFSYLSDEQVQRLSSDQKKLIRSLRGLLQLDLLMNTDFGLGRLVIVDDEPFRLFHEIVTLPGE